MSHSISLVMIVRDEERSLARCLASVRDVVDEIVVVDTGSTDSTVEIARSYGAKVSHFDWVDDFSAARNFSLARATGEWRLVLDADDWLDDAGRVSVAELRRREPTFVGLVEYVSLVGPDDDPSTQVSWAARVLPPDARYERPVHEQVVSSHPYGRLGLSVQHDGYVTSRIQGKGDRNRRILAAELEQRPDDPYVLYQLGKELGLTVSSELAADTLALAARYVTPGAVYRCDLVVNWIDNLRVVGRYDEAVEVADRHAEDLSASADFWWALAQVWEAAGDLDRAAALWEICLAVGDTSPFSGAVVGAGSTWPAGKLAIYRHP